MLKHSVVAEWINNREIKFGCILETRVKERKAGKILNNVFRDWSSITNYEDSRGGIIWFLWRDSVRITPVYKTDQLVTVRVEMEDEEGFFCMSIYASNQVEERKVLWEDLIHQHESPSFKNKAWMVLGDFNEILEGDESSSFDNGGRMSCGMRDFKALVLRCRLADMAYQGPRYTWCNKREEGIICNKLDRVLLNEEALLRFSNAYSVFESGGCSDHMRCKVQSFPPRVRIKRPFKYVNALGSLPSFLPMVKDYWDATESLFHSTSAMFRFSKKLKNLKLLIREMGREKMGNISKRAKEAFDSLCIKHNFTLANPSEEAIQDEAEAYGRWLHVASLEEDFLKQKAKLHWLDIGDQNNKTYHRAITSREAQNMIREIRCVNGDLVNSHLEIKQEAESFFSEFLNRIPENFQGTNKEELRSLLDFTCSDEDCRLLEEEVTAEEVRKVLFAMPNNKSPGPDGYPAKFFKTTWSVLAQDFTIAVQSVF